jgi:effector-binding domain-containing protein
MNDREKGFAAGLRALATHWRLLLALVAVIIGATIYLERKLLAPQPAVEADAPPAPIEPVPPNAPAAAPPSDKKASPDAAKPAAPEGNVENPADTLASQLTDIPARPALVLKGEGKWDDAQKILSEAIAKLSEAAKKSGLAVNGRPLTAFTETSDAGFHYEVMTPIAKAPEGAPKLADGVELGASPAGKALKFQHRGSYDDIDSTYEAITAYLDEKGLDAKSVFVEEYLTDLKAEDENGEVDIYVFVK